VRKERIFLLDYYFSEINIHILLHSFIEKVKRDYKYKICSLLFIHKILHEIHTREEILNSILYDFVLQKVKNCSIVFTIKISSD